MIARSWFGAQDLYYGVPNLQDAVVSEVVRDEDNEDYATTLVFTLKSGKQFRLTIKQAK